MKIYTLHCLSSPIYQFQNYSSDVETNFWLNKEPTQSWNDGWYTLYSWRGEINL